MLRHKLLVVVGSVIALLMLCGVAAILLLQNVLQDLEHVASEAITGTRSVAAIQLELTDLQLRLQQIEREPQSVRLSRAEVQPPLIRIDEQTRQLAQLDAARGEGSQIFVDYVALVRTLSQQIGALCDSPASATPRDAQHTLLRTRETLIDLQAASHAHTEREQQAANAKFRWTALGFGLAFVAVINGLIMISARFSTMILKPVDQLVEAGRRLANEDFSHRVNLNRRDEFGELASAYNALAAQLQANEARRVETLHQVARTLSHELNNAISIIQLQLDLAARSAGGNGLQSDRLRQIQQALGRMSATVADLTRVRRIVLTDYLSGVKMLDLPKSVEDEPAAKA